MAGNTADALNIQDALGRTFSPLDDRLVCNTQRYCEGPRAPHPSNSSHERRAMSNLRPNVVGLSWFREEDYPALLRIFDDADKMPRLWKDWLKGAEQLEQRVKAQGYATERVYIDPDSFASWCGAEGVGVDREGRNRFVAVTMAAKYRQQS